MGQGAENEAAPLRTGQRAARVAVFVSKKDVHEARYQFLPEACTSSGAVSCRARMRKSSVTVLKRARPCTSSDAVSCRARARKSSGTVARRARVARAAVTFRAEQERARAAEPFRAWHGCAKATAQFFAGKGSARAAEPFRAEKEAVRRARQKRARAAVPFRSVPGKSAQEQRKNLVPDQKQRDETGDLKMKKKVDKD